MNWLKRLCRQALAMPARHLLAPLAFVAAAALTACGGGSGGSSLASSGCGAVSCSSAVVTITDAPGDFLSYTVNIVSLKLQRDDGTVVETLPATTTVDFAKLVDLTEVISAKQVPPGKYVAGTVTLDYTGATIVVDNGTTSGLTVSPVDSSGNALGTVDMQVQLDSSKPLVINDHTSGNIAFDFNLLASNTVDTTKATVTVNPVLMASIVPPAEKDMRVRGGFVSADTSGGNTFTLTVKPFYSTSMSQGSFTVHVTSATSYEINGTPYTGDAGLAQLATLSADTLVVAIGTLTTADRTFTATQVLAGSSVDNSKFDGVQGVVIARSGNSLTVGSATLERHGGDCRFDHRPFTVTLDSTTGVTQAGSGSALDIGAISVGQRIHAFGKFDTSASTPTLDATGANGGHVRLEVTSLWGLVNTATAGSSGGSGSVDLSLKSIEGRRASDFNFAGTGAASDGSDDANAAHYLVDTGILTIPASFTAGNPARFFGFVTAFGAAAPTATTPVLDFSAVTLVDYAQTNARLKIDWADPGFTTPFASLDATSGLTLGDLSGAKQDVIAVGPLVTVLTSLSTLPAIVGDSSSNALYAIVHEAPTSQHPNAATTYASFADFVAALTTALDGTNTVEHVAAEGTYDPSAGKFTATRMVVVFEN